MAGRPTCTRQDLLDFFAANSYADKLMAQREKIMNDFSMPGSVDY